jgi:hypothetical protein
MGARLLLLTSRGSNIGSDTHTQELWAGHWTREVTAVEGVTAVEEVTAVEGVTSVVGLTAVVGELCSVGILYR